MVVNVSRGTSRRNMILSMGIAGRNHVACFASKLLCHLRNSQICNVEFLTCLFIKAAGLC